MAPLYGGEKLEARRLLASWLEVPYYNQDQTGWCWATSLAMLVEYYGGERKPWQIAADFDKGTDTGLALGEIGSAEAYLDTYYGQGNTDAWQSDTFFSSISLKSMLQTVLDAGDPVWIGSTAAAHAVVVTGYLGDQVFINDPSGALSGDGTNVVQKAFTWSEFNSLLDLHWLSLENRVYAIHAKPGLLTDAPTRLSVEVRPRKLWFESVVDGVPRKLELIWDGASAYDGGYRYSPTASGLYTSDSDGAYVNYGYNATQADVLNVRASYSNYALPGQTLLARTRLEVRRADNNQLVHSILSGVDTVNQLAWQGVPTNSAVNFPLATLSAGIYKLDISVEGASPSTPQVFSLRDRSSFYFGVTSAPTNSGPTINTLTATPNPVVIGQPVTLKATGVADADGVLGVDFYYDTNGNGFLNIGTDVKVDAGTRSGSDWSLGISTTGLNLGTHRYFAIGYDNGNRPGSVASCDVVVQSSGSTNTPPSIGALPDFATAVGTPITIPFTVSDAQTSAGSLLVGFGSSNTTLVPTQNFSFGGGGANRTVKITPAAGRSGTTTITLIVQDGGGLTGSRSFTLSVGGQSGVVDLLGTRFRATPSLVDAGDVVDIDFTVANQRSGSSGPFTVAFYLSANSAISTSDELLGTYAISNLGANTSLALDTSLTLPPRGSDAYENGDGQYHIGMIIDSTNAVVEDDEGNNRNEGDDEDRDTVTIRHTQEGSSGDIDLLPEYFNADPDQLQPGQQATLTFEVRNDGGNDARNFEAEFYISRDGVITDDDEYLGKYNFDELEANDSSGRLTDQVTLPALGDAFWQDGDGQYVIGMIVDADDDVAETNESNNSNTGDADDHVTIFNTDGRAGDRFEPNDQLNQATQLGVVEGRTFYNDLSFHTVFDEDAFRFTVVNNGRVSFRASETSSTPYTTYMVFFDASGQGLDQAAYNTTNIVGASVSTSSFDGRAGETYYVKVIGHVGIEYDLRVDAPYRALTADHLEPNSADNPTAIGVIDGVRQYSGLTIHDYGDEDYFTFTMPHDTGGRVTLTALDETRNVSASLLHFDPLLSVASTRVGNVTTFDLGPGSQGQYRLAVTGAPLAYSWSISPTLALLSTSTEFETRQAIRFSFNAAVASSLSASDLILKRQGVGDSFFASGVESADGGKSATFRFSELLPDGYYTATVPGGTVEDTAGGVLAADAVGSFFVLAADANRDRKVDFADLVVLAQNYNTTGKTFSQGNFDYSPGGAVNFADLVVLAQRYNVSLGSLAALLEPGSLPGATPVSTKGKPDRVARGVLG